MLVRELMTRQVVSVSPGDTIAIARDRLRAHQIHHLLVVDAGAVLGVIAMRDLAGKPETTRVDEVMTREVATIDGDATLRRAASLMIRGTTGCQPVHEEGKPTGIITTTDVMRELNADMTLS